MASAPAVKVGDLAQFLGYAEDIDDQILQEGETVRVTELRRDGTIVVFPVDGGQGDSVFPEELALLENSDDMPEDESDELPEAEVERIEAAIEEVEGPAADTAEEPIAEKAPTPEELALVEAPKPIVPGKKKAKPTAQEVAAAAAAKTLASASKLVIVDETTKDVVELADSPWVSGWLTHEQDALAAAKALSARGNETYLTLGGVLAHIYHEKSYETVGYKGKRAFNEYVDKELGVDYRRAMYLIDIYVTFRRLGVDEERLAPIGWSKLKELTPYVTTENVNRLLALANGATREELVLTLKETSITTIDQPVEKVKKTRVAVSLYPDQAEIVNRALEVAGRQFNGDQNQALQLMAADYLSLTEGVHMTIEQEIHRIERKYDVNLLDYVEQLKAAAT